VSTIAGKDIWYDSDIQKLNEDGRGQYLGQFEGEDKVLAIFKNGTFYTTSFDLVNKYQGDVLSISKFDPDLTYTALYYDGAAKTFYVKRFSFVESDNSPMLFISDAPKSYLVELSSDKHPQYKCTFGGKSAHKEPECIDAEEWIGKKGITAKGKKCHDREQVKKVEFVEPLVKPEDELPEVPEEVVAEMPEVSDELPEFVDELPEEPMEIILPDEEDLSLPTGEIVLPDPEKTQDSVPELIIEEPTLF